MCYVLRDLIVPINIYLWDNKYKTISRALMPTTYFQTYFLVYAVHIEKRVKLLQKQDYSTLLNWCPLHPRR